MRRGHRKERVASYRAHAMKRAIERLGTARSDELRAIEQRIRQEPRGGAVRKASASRTFYKTKLGGEDVYVLYSKTDKCIVTVYTEAMFRAWAEREDGATADFSLASKIPPRPLDID